MVDLFEIHFDDAQEFLDYLRPSKKHWGNFGWYKQWLFRGQGNDKWSLTPSAWRDTDRLNVTHSELPKIVNKALNSVTDETRKRIPYIQQLVELAASEFMLIDEFVKLADNTGFLLPRLDEWREFSQDFFRHYTKNFIESPLNNKPWVYPIVALAQHHGVRTRLLDWTENPLVASYFAILGYNILSKAERESIRSIVVYAIHDSMIGRDIKKLTVSRAENLNLRLQEGLFLYHVRSDEYYAQNGRFPTIDETLRSYSLDFYPYKVENPYQRITFSIGDNPPHKRSIDVLRDFLARENITTSHLMPSLDNVARTVKNRFDIS